MSAAKRKTRKAAPPPLDPSVREALEDRLGYRFSDPVWIERALTHASARSGPGSYERLEFLGDRVLGLVMAERLFFADRAAQEGALARRFNRLVDKTACAEAARRLALGPALIMDPSEEGDGGREKDSILGDAMEAVIAAVFVDGGLSKAKALIERAFPVAPEHVPDGRDPKTKLQEWAQARGYPTPRYQTLDREGPDHAPSFRMQVVIDGLGDWTGHGGSKQDGERAAAKAALGVLHARDKDAP